MSNNENDLQRTAELATEYVALHAERGNPKHVLKTLDTFATEESWLMNVGPEKGPLIGELKARLPAAPRVLELGAYCGYSAIMIADILGPASRITSIELEPRNVKSATANVAHAGLGEQVRFIAGSSTEQIPTLEGVFDLVFLDHWKDLYKQDLQLIEQLRLIQPGSVVVADNVGEHFNPEEFLDYVRTCGLYDCENRVATIEYTDVPDAVEICVMI